MKICLPVSVLLLVAVSTPRVLARKWTDSTGKYTVEADFVDFKDGAVHLKKGNGRIITVPMEKLSKADQEYVREQTYPFLIQEITDKVPMRLNPRMPGQGRGQPLCALL